MWDPRALDKQWNQLPAAGIPGLKARWVGPLVDRGFDTWLCDMSQGAYGHLEDCGWLDAIQSAPPMLDEQGKVQPGWVNAIRQAAESLAEAGRYSGPDGAVERWASWLLFELSAPHDWVKSRVAA